MKKCGGGKFRLLCALQDQAGAAIRDFGQYHDLFMYFNWLYTIPHFRCGKGSSISNDCA
jgi:hypothetical protein